MVPDVNFKTAIPQLSKSIVMINKGMIPFWITGIVFCGSFLFQWFRMPIAKVYKVAFTIWLGKLAIGPERQILGMAYTNFQGAECIRIYQRLCAQMLIILGHELEFNKYQSLQCWRRVLEIPATQCSLEKNSNTAIITAYLHERPNSSLGYFIRYLCLF